MRRLATTALLGGLLTLSLPMPSALACSPALPSLGTSATQVPAGGTVRVTSDQTTGVPICEMPPMPTPPPTSTVAPSEEPSESASGNPTIGPSQEPSEEPSETASVTPEPTATTTTPAPVPVAPAAAPARPLVVAAAAKPAVPVVVTLIKAEPDTYYGDLDGPARTLTHDGVPTTEPYKEGTRHLFKATVRIPADTAPGTYVLHAMQQGVVNFGYADLTVLPTLPVSGTATDDLVRLAALCLLAGVGSLVVATQAPAKRCAGTSG